MDFGVEEEVESNFKTKMKSRTVCLNVFELFRISVETHGVLCV